MRNEQKKDPLLEEWAKAVGFDTGPSMDELLQEYVRRQAKLRTIERRQMLLAHIIIGFAVAVYFASIAASICLSCMTFASVFLQLTNQYWCHPLYQVGLLGFAAIVGLGVVKGIERIERK